MSFGIKSGRPLAQEIRRLLDQEISVAVSCLTDPSRAGAANGVHVARKHVKKARAVLQLARPSLADKYRDADEALRIANRALGPLADAYRVTQTLARVQTHDATVTPGMLQAIRVRLMARASVVEEQAVLGAVRARAVRLLDATRRQVAAWDLEGIDGDTAAAETRQAHALARDSRRKAARRPRIEALHQWRRRVKREWHLLRLLAGAVGDRLSDEQHQLETLDGALGDLHDLNVLIAEVAADSPLSRPQTARVLRALRARARDLRRHAQAVAGVLKESPHRLERRIIALWGQPPRTTTSRRGDRWLRRA